MSSAASVGSDEHLRLFFGLPLPLHAADSLAAWGHEVYAVIPAVRVVPSRHLHVTLAFLGKRPAAELAALRGALRDAAGLAEQPLLTVSRYRETERVAMLVLDDLEGRARRLQAGLSERLERLGAFVPERRPWLAHVTVARYRRRPRLRPPLPGVPAMSPSEAALYHSLLRPGGAQYEILEAIALGG
jgi:2'-5' RNA ligase